MGQPKEFKMPKGKILMGKDPKPPREEVYGKRDRRDAYPGPVDKARNPDRPERNRKVIYAAPKPERRPVDERGVVRRGPGGPAGAVAPKKRGMDRKELPGPTRTEPMRKQADNKRGPVKPRTAEEKKFIMDQPKKNPGRGSNPKFPRTPIKGKPVMPRQGGK